MLTSPLVIYVALMEVRTKIRKNESGWDFDPTDTQLQGKLARWRERDQKPKLPGSLGTGKFVLAKFSSSNKQNADEVGQAHQAGGES